MNLEILNCPTPMDRFADAIINDVDASLCPEYCEVVRDLGWDPGVGRECGRRAVIASIETRIYFCAQCWRVNQ